MRAVPATVCRSRATAPSSLRMTKTGLFGNLRGHVVAGVLELREVAHVMPVPVEDGLLLALEDFGVETRSAPAWE